ncbi:hypothetical protein B0T19DRAFT_87467 [Cercophora scortea]|uniref:Uncharacterized protein n=1 Tax=Cercophora scortea TaxID=314031 RepID=A0AAE0IVE3_9PEZI|nr:hypothetical protein B0T19DRAFT_87467 [Cercophora scortea]
MARQTRKTQSRFGKRTSIPLQQKKPGNIPGTHPSNRSIIMGWKPRSARVWLGRCFPLCITCAGASAGRSQYRAICKDEAEAAAPALIGGTSSICLSQILPRHACPLPSQHQAPNPGSRSSRQERLPSSSFPRPARGRKFDLRGLDRPPAWLPLYQPICCAACRQREPLTTWKLDLSVRFCPTSNDRFVDLVFFCVLYSAAQFNSFGQTLLATGASKPA